MNKHHIKNFIFHKQLIMHVEQFNIGEYVLHVITETINFFSGGKG